MQGLSAPERGGQYTVITWCLYPPAYKKAICRPLKLRRVPYSFCALCPSSAEPGYDERIKCGRKACVSLQGDEPNDRSLPRASTVRLTTMFCPWRTLFCP